MRSAALLLVLVSTLAACDGEAPPAGGALPQFAGRFHIFETEMADAAAGGVQDLLPRPRWIEKTRQLFAGESLGTVTVAPALGGDYTEWNVTFTNPPHEIRVLVGARRGDGTRPAWRFEQQPAPAFRHDGIARLEGDTLVADFASSRGDAAVLRERWTRTADGLAFALEVARDGNQSRRVGGFTARE